jgi:hypothetical protein
MAATGVGTDILTYRYNGYGNGANTNETTLSLDNVTPTGFGLKFSVPVKGQIYAQPLYKSGIRGKNLVFVASQENVVMAIDSATGTNVWKVVLNHHGKPVPNSDVNSGDISPYIGICSTPVISGTSLYVISKSQINHRHFYYTIYKLDTATGKILGFNNFADTLYKGFGYSYRTGKIHDPYVAGTGDGAVTVKGQSRVYFNALRQMNRSALSLVNGVIYAGFASHGDNGPYHGWVLGFDPGNLQIVAVFNTTPNGGMAGIWEAGGRLSSDDQNNLYLETGNGSFDGSQLDGSGFPIDANYGDCFIKLAWDQPSTETNQNSNGWRLKVVDYFTPSNNDTINGADLDLGSCGPLVVPGNVQTVIIGMGKDGTLFSMNSTNMGRFDPSTNNCIQTINGAFCSDPNNFWTGCTASYFNNRIYAAGSSDVIKQFSLTNGVFGGWFNDSNGIVQTDVESAESFQFPGANTSVSANGTNSGILWAVDRSASVLRAYRTTDLLEIWSSDQVQADQFGGALKFTVPVVANGMVFLGTDGALKIFGLVPAQPH